MKRQKESNASEGVESAFLCFFFVSLDLGEHPFISNKYNKVKRMEYFVKKKIHDKKKKL